ncbi:hypothetical protein DPMN_144772 [Dreissena polymorpha]|uniref:Uncharacterized protein n=1 Tax=Dreissena polymorpha TaxID=45954 RepID=A0A9D4F2Q1_DREPO|nr:hypothetical protein DPMN_144772 [Dreissena polymorpha]
MPSKTNPLCIQQSPRHFVPFNTAPLPAITGLHSQSTDLISGRSSSPAISILVPENEPFLLEAYEKPQSGIPTSISADYIQTTGLADSSTEYENEHENENEYKNEYEYENEY